MEYSIHELSTLSGVSTRTLRYYDEMGLLCPSRTNEAGYRFYNGEKADLLQQILFYRERGLSLAKIRSIIYDENFDKLEALLEHLKDLEQQQSRISRLICTVNKTIASMKGELQMDDKQKFEAFKKDMVAENENVYGSEIRTAYGDDTVDASNRKMLHMTQEEYLRFEALANQIQTELEQAVAADIDPKSSKGQTIVSLHKEWLCCTWKEYSPAAHRGLASIYLADERFKGHYDQNISGCAQFLVQAIMRWTEN